MFCVLLFLLLALLSCCQSNVCGKGFPLSPLLLSLLHPLLLLSSSQSECVWTWNFLSLLPLLSGLLLSPISSLLLLLLPLFSPVLMCVRMRSFSLCPGTPVGAAVGSVTDSKFLTGAHLCSLVINWCTWNAGGLLGNTDSGHVIPFWTVSSSVIFDDFSICGQMI